MTRRTCPTLWLAALAPLALAACDAADDDGTDTDTDPAATDEACPDDEIPYNGVDDDCDPTTPDDDLDGDGDLADVDCDDQDPSRGPHADDVGFDGVDQDCDGADLDASPTSPSLRVDLALPADLAFPSVAIGTTHAFVVGREAAPAQGAGLRGALVDLRTGAVTTFVQDAPDTGSTTRNVVAWVRGGGFGVLVAHEDWGTGGRCHLYATPVGSDGVAATRRRLTDVATSQAMCDTGQAVWHRDGVDDVFHFQPQGFLLGGGELTNPQLVRRVVDIDTGTESDVDGYGVNQGGNFRIGSVWALGDRTVLANQFGRGGSVTKLSLFEPDGASEEFEVLAAPPTPFASVTDGVADPGDGTQTGAVLRTTPDAVDAVPTLEWAQITITPGEPSVGTLTVGGPVTPAVVGRVEGLQGVAAVVADVEGDYRAVWMEGGVLRGTTTTVDEAADGDARLAGQAASLRTVTQVSGRSAYLVSVGDGDAASLHLVLSGR